MTENDKCPNCGGDLERIGPARARCRYCGEEMSMQYTTPFVQQTVSTSRPISNDTPNNASNSVQFPVTSKGVVVRGYKSVFLTFLISFFLPGLGYAYVGKVGLGIILFLLAYTFIFLLTVSPFFILGYMAIWLIGMFGACNMAKDVNAVWSQHSN